MEQKQENAIDSVVQQPAVKATSSKAWVFPAITAVLFAASTGYFGWQYWKLKTHNNDLSSEITALKKQAASQESAKSKSSDESSSATKDSSTSTETVVTLTDKQKETIVASLNTMNTQPLEGYMADEVSVVIAASEGQGVKSPADAVASLNYFSSATTPWDFGLGASVLSSYGKGFYAQYFGENTYVGKAASKQVVSFHTNSSGKIDVIFIAADEMLLTE